MRRAYLAVSLDHRADLESVIQALHSCLQKISIELFVFVDHYHFDSNDEVKMMETAMMEIDRSDILIAEVSVKAIGVGLEVGYATAKNKAVWYLRNRNAPHSSTVSGIATERVFYLNEQDLVDQLADIIRK